MSESNTCWTGTNGSQEDQAKNQDTKSALSCSEAPPSVKRKNSCKIRYSRIFKKVSSDGNLVLFLPQRELAVSENRVESLMGVALIHENVMKITDIKVYLQVVLIFRYGREDEELMGLRFCNEVVVAAEQIYPTAMEEAVKQPNQSKSDGDGESTNNSKAVQQRRNSTLVNNQGFIAVPFVVDMGAVAPPSIRLIPCRPYSGAPIGTSYVVQLFANTTPDELPRRRKMVQMSLRLFEKLPKEIAPSPNIIVQKNFVFSDKPLTITAGLDKGIYAQGDEIRLTLSIQRKDKHPHGVRKVKVTAFQQVSVAMFSTGNFKNNIGEGEVTNQPNPRDSDYESRINLTIKLSKDYAWAAMDETAKQDSDLTQLAPTVTHSNKCLFVVRVTYYVQVFLMFGLLKRPVGIKLPFLLKRTDTASSNPPIMTKTNLEETQAEDSKVAIKKDP